MESGHTLDQGGQAQFIVVEDLTGEYKKPCAFKRVFKAERHERFRNEVEAIKSLSHPNIVRLLDHSALDVAPGDDGEMRIAVGALGTPMGTLENCHSKTDVNSKA
jgi:serine/threonine-protein kinase